MSFVYCRQCGWSQDDFWDFGFGRPYGYWWRWKYNPFSLFLSHVRDYGLRPRWLSFDPKFVLGPRVHSWRLHLHHLTRMLRGLRDQRWWTRRAWVRARQRGFGKCPSCGNKLHED
jgi:hypothetical protein